jgi:transcriptional regulator with XRE-family HTH domain
MGKSLGNFSLACKQSFPKQENYIVCMHKQRPNPRESLAKNVAMLLRIHNMGQSDLARKSGVNQKTISNIVHGKNAPNLDKVDAIAKAFGLDAWHLILPNLPEEIANGGAIAQLVENFLASDSESRKYINHVAEREAAYKSQR